LNSPLTPEKIRMACEDKFTKMIPRDEPGSYVPWKKPVRDKHEPLEELAEQLQTVPPACSALRC
ncbi:hypothetical protein NP565_24530, partial [Vibrio parahaemolyticus]|nr:hypothetical protein [Vibrio parahaemolyticus]